MIYYATWIQPLCKAVRPGLDFTNELGCYQFQFQIRSLQNTPGIASLEH